MQEPEEPIVGRQTYKSQSRLKGGIIKSDNPLILEVKPPMPLPITFFEIYEQLKSHNFLKHMWLIHEDMLKTGRESAFDIARSLETSKSSFTPVDQGLREGVGGFSPFGSDPLNDTQETMRIDRNEIELLHVHSHPPDYWFRPSDSDFMAGRLASIRNWVKIHQRKGIDIKDLRKDPKLKLLYPHIRFDERGKTPHGGGKVEREYRPYFLILQPISETSAQVILWYDDPDNQKGNGQGTIEDFFDEDFGQPRDIARDDATCQKIIEFYDQAGFASGIGFIERTTSGDISFREFHGGLFQGREVAQPVDPRRVLKDLASINTE